MRRRRRSRSGRDAPLSPLPPAQGCAAVGGPVLAGAATPSLLLPAPGCDAIAAPGLRRLSQRRTPAAQNISARIGTTQAMPATT